MNAHDMEWNDLRVVLAVCRQGSLSAAARELGINHSTVFRRINSVEEKLSLRLFERLPTGYAMTEAGESVLAASERIESEVFTLSRQLAGADMRLSGLLQVTAPDALTLKILTPHFVHFCQTYPNIRFELSLDNRFLDLSMREADVAIRSTLKPPEWVIGRKLCRLDVSIYGSKTYLDAHNDESLDTYHWLMPRDDQDWYSANQWLTRKHPKATVIYRSDNLSALAEATVHGLGVAPLPLFLAESSRELRCLIDPPSALSSELWLLTHPDLRRTARVQAFTTYIAEVIEAERHRIERRSPRR